MRNIYCICFACIAAMMTACGCTEKISGENGNGGGSVAAVSRVSVIPMPEKLTYGTSDIVLPDGITVSTSLTGGPLNLLSETITALGRTVSPAADEGAFIRIAKDESMGTESYTISITENGCTVGYGDDAGLLWGIQTLRQILMYSSGGKIPCLEIEDAPAKSWRGFQVDVARHIFGFDYLKTLTDLLSLYKINKLQLHLTDDQGWRLEIKQYPKLTETGAWRPLEDMERNNIAFIDPQFIRNGTEYGGCFTQEQMKELVAYAAERGIEVIPEIDVPGHSSAAIDAYPELSCTGETGWGEEFSYPLCAGDESTFEFFRNVMDEVADLFGSKHFHIGGDEVETGIWADCPVCQEKLEELGYRKGDETELWTYFLERVAEHLAGKGLEVMTWDDAFRADKPLDVIYTFWRDWEPQQAASITQMGYPLVFMEWQHFYLSADVSDEQLKALYEYNTGTSFPGMVNSNLAGYQAACFTEKICYEDRLSYHIFPSLYAFAELAWGTADDWNGFISRLPQHLALLDEKDINYRLPDFIR